MADLTQKTNKVVEYKITGDNTSLIKSINSAITKIDALEKKLNRIATKKDVSALGKNQQRDAISRINSIMRATSDLAKMRDTLSNIDVSLLSKPQLALLKEAKVQIKELSDKLGKASAAGSVSKQTLDSTTKTIHNMQQAFKNAKIAVIDLDKEEKQNAKAAKYLDETYNKTVASIKRGITTLINIFRNLGRVTYELMSYAADYGETMNKFNVVAGDASVELSKYVQKMNDLLGLDIADLYDAAAAFKSIANSIKLSKDQAITFTESMTSLAVDLASLYNTSTAQAINALTSGLHGLQKPLKAYDIYLYEANIEQAALTHGITKSVSKMNESEKVLLRYISILDQSKGAQGDMARTLESTSNQLRIAHAQFAQLKRSLGQVATVAAFTVVPALNLIFASISKIAAGLASSLGYEITDFTNIFGDSSESVDNATESLEEYEDAAAGLSGLDEINLIQDTNKSSPAIDPNTGGLAIDKNILAALKGYDNEIDKISSSIGKASSFIAESLSGTLMGEAFKLFVKGIKAIGDGFTYVVENYAYFEPIIKSLINLLTIFAALAIGKKIKGWTDALATFVGKIKGFDKALPTVTKNIRGEIEYTQQSVSGLTLAVGALTFAIAQAAASAIYNQLEGETKQVAATIGALISILTAAAMAWLAYHGTMTWGTAIPIITGAVGVGLASLQAMIPQMATGGVVDQPTVAMIGEGRYNEAVVPLGNSPQFKEMKGDIAGEVARKISPNPAYSFGQPSGGQTPVVLRIDGRDLARALLPYLGYTQPQTGVKLK